MSLDLTVADTFVRSGGVISWAEWKELPDSEKDALLEARQRWEAERIYRVSRLINNLNMKNDSASEIDNEMIMIFGEDEWRRIAATRQA